MEKLHWKQEEKKDIGKVYIAIEGKQNEDLLVGCEVVAIASKSYLSQIGMPKTEQEIYHEQ